jgi:DNA-binding NtrC family response regulator
MHEQDNETRSHKSKATILVVDDEPQVAEVLRGILEFEGFEVETVENGKQALDRITSVDRFDLIITDMKMPEMDGLELLTQVQKLSKDLPVIVLTAYATLKNGLNAIKDGVYDYVSKPFSVKILMNVVHEALKDKA